MDVTNISNGPRGINTHEGLRLLEKGETASGLKVTAKELEVAEATGWFKIKGSPTEAENAPAPAVSLEDDQKKLLEVAETRKKLEAEVAAMAAARQKLEAEVKAMDDLKAKAEAAAASKAK